MWLLSDIGREVHITPMDDLRPHDMQSACWCKPVEHLELDGVWVHNSLDQREEFESGERLPS